MRARLRRATLRCRRVARELRGIDAMLLQQVVQGRPRHAQKLARRATDLRGPPQAPGVQLAPRLSAERRADSDTQGRRPGPADPRSIALTTADSAMMTAPLMRFSSSRTLPGQRCAWIARMASGANPWSRDRSACAISCSMNCASKQAVALAIAQRRHAQRDFADAVIQIVAEPAACRSAHRGRGWWRR